MMRRQAIVLTLVTLTVGGAMLACGESKRANYGSNAEINGLAHESKPATPSRTLPADAGGLAGPTNAVVADTFSPNIAMSLTPSAASAPPIEVLPSAMLIRQGTASVQVDSLDAGIYRVREMARRLGAVVANTEMQTGKDQLHSASIELRLPSSRFDDAVSGLSPIGKLESVNVTVADVGEEYVDVEARMTNARRLEQRLIDLLAHRTGKLADVLSVEHELARVREEIERYEGRLRYLRTRTSISTLTVSVHEPAPLVSPPGQSPIREAFKQAWRNFVDVLAGMISSLGVIVPIGVLLGGLVWVGRRLLPWTAKS